VKLSRGSRYRKSLRPAIKNRKLKIEDWKDVFYYNKEKPGISGQAVFEKK
jgi:hypothetical protein